MPPPFASFLRAHFNAHRRRNGPAFFWRVSLEWFVASTAPLLLIATFHDFTPRRDLEELSPALLFIVACIGAPLVETLFQSLPVMVARRFRAGFWTQVFVAIVPFAAMHFRISVVSGICAGIVGGFYLAFFYAHWRETSLGRAYWMTCAAHAFSNFVIVAVVLLAKGLEGTA
jgi:hypothetical protein